MFEKSLKPVEFELNDTEGQKGLFDGAVKVKVTPVVTRLEVEFKGREGDTFSKDGHASTSFNRWYGDFGDMTMKELEQDCLEELQRMRSGRRYCQ